MLDSPAVRRTLLACALLIAGAGLAGASPDQLVPVDDAIVDELRVLDLYAPGRDRVPVALAHLGAGPWSVRELTQAALLQIPGAPLGAGPRAIAACRIMRVLGRDCGDGRGPAGVTPRTLQAQWPDGTRAELSLGVEGEAQFARAARASTHRWADGSGVHARLGLQADRWLIYSHVWFGELRGVRAFSDALVANTDLAASTDESYLLYSAPAWNAQLGRNRWAWGPGEAGSLLLSRTSPSVNGFMLHLRLAPLHADAFAFSATVDPGTGEQLAAHRLEWQPVDAVRLGVAEAARYHAGGWQGAYLSGVIPYAMVQRLLDRDHRDSTGALRNNVMVAADASVRIADGSRIYGELLVDDLHARTAQVPNKYGGQLGWSGTGAVGRARLSWSSETTWLSRYVYTSFFGRTYAAQGQPLGFPTGPGARRWRTRVTCDPAVDWQFGVVTARTEHGREGLFDPFLPGQPVPDVATLATPVERSRTVDATARWWPAGGVDLSVRLGREWLANAGNTTGAQTRSWRGALVFRLTR